MKAVRKEGQFLASSVVGLLKSCGKQKDLPKGSKLHAYIQEHEVLDKNCYVGCALVHMYARCGALSEAQQVFNKLVVRDAVTWTALITVYAQQGQGEEALKCFNNMQREGHSPDALTFTCVLKACGSIGAAAEGEKIHEKVVSLGMLEKSVVLGSALVDMYARCGFLAKAEQVLENLPVRGLVTWTALMDGYAHQGQGERALKCFDSMQREGYSPDAVTFTCALKACANIGAAAKGEEIHSKIMHLGILQKNVVLGSALVDMYVRCGVLARAHGVLKELHVRDVVTWNALLAGYTQQGEGEKALKCFDSMQREGHSPNTVTFMCALKACARIGAAAEGKQIHDHIVNLGLLKKNVVLGSIVVDMYARCGELEKAQQVLEGLAVRDVVDWNALIAGYAQQAQGLEALQCFDCMQHEGYSPDVVTFTCALNACGGIGAATKGEQIHDKIVSLGLLEKNIMLGSTLVDMYAKCGALAKAQEVLFQLPVRNVITWSALIAGYIQQGQGEEALKCFDSMLYEGHSPDAVIFTYALKACGNVGAVAKGEEVHGKIMNLGMLENNIVLQSALLDMYCRFGAFDKAQQVLEEFPARDVVMWTALIIAYCQQGQGDEALKCFDRMQQEGQCPNVITFTCALKACGSIGALAKGEEIHENIVTLGLLEKNIALQNTLVDMYAKCALFPKALQLLEDLPAQDVVTWNTLIGGCAQQGQSAKALYCFERMQYKGMKPNLATLTCVLNACSHAGLLDQAEMIFSSTSADYSDTPDVEHYSCMADLYSRAGKLNKALEVIEKMPFVEHPPVWVSLLGACRKWENVKIGRHAFDCVVYLDRMETANYVCMFNMYIIAGMQEDANKIEAMRVANKA